MPFKIQFFREPIKPVTPWKLFKVWLGILFCTLMTLGGMAWYQQEQPRYGIFIGVLLGGTIGLFVQYFAQHRNSDHSRESR